MKKLAITITFVFSLFFNVLNAQIVSQVAKADTLMRYKNYSKAIQMYQKIIESGKTNYDAADVYKKIATGYLEMNDYKQSILYFEKYLGINKNDKEAKFNYGDMLLRSGDYKKALNVFTELSKSAPENSEYKRMIACCNRAAVELQKPNIPPIRNQELINSKESEFGLAFFDNKLIFASSRLTSDYSSIHERTNQGFSDFYGATFDTVYRMYNKPVKMNWTLNTPQYNEGTFAFNPVSKIAYYTQCKRNPDLCRILKAKWNDGKWSDIKEVLSSIPNYDFAHPALSGDFKTLYFSSNMPGGFGGNDIWKAPILADGDLGKPFRLDSTINTSRNEMFPSLIGDSILLFSSEGQIGMGGLDIFYSKFKDDLFERPIDIGSPINSTSDDFGILLNTNLRGGYFCSNRENAEKSDDIYAFFHNIFLEDIRGKIVDSLTYKPIADAKITYSVGGQPTKIAYSDANGKFVIPNSAHALCEDEHSILVEKDKYYPKTIAVPCYSENDIIVLMDDGSGRFHKLEGIVTDKKTGRPIPGATVNIKSLKGMDATAYTDENGKYVFPQVNADDYITLRASKDGYLTDSKSFMTPAGPGAVNISPETGYDTGFGLYPIERNVEFRIENIYYEFDKANLLPESKVSLNKLVNILMENPQVMIKINSHTDTRGSDSYNMKLSGRRGESVVNYLVAAGIDMARLKSQGYGETRPEIPNARTEEEHQLNRRTTFEILGEDEKILAKSNRPGEKSMYAGLSGEQVLKIIEDAKKEGKVIDEAFLMELKLRTGLTQPANTDIVTHNVSAEPVLKSSEIEVVKNYRANEKTPEATRNTFSGLFDEVYRVQLVSTSQPVNLKKQFAKIYDLIEKYGITVTPVDNVKKYQMGNFKDKIEAVNLKSLLNERGYKDTFIVTIKK